MTLHGAEKQKNEQLKREGKLTEAAQGLFDPTFMDNLSPALPYCEQLGVKIAVNAGASDTELLAKLVEQEVRNQGLSLKVAWVAGDEVTETVKKMYADGEVFPSLMNGKSLKEWGHEVVAAQ